MTSTRIATLLVAASLSLPALAQAESIAVVNGTSIDKTALDNAVTAVVQSSGGNVQDSPSLREQLKGTLINRTLILQEASKRGLDKQPEFTKRLNEIREDMMREALFADFVKQNPPSDAQIKARYDETAAKLNGTKEVHARQITVASEADAQKVIAALKKGSKFEDLVRARSIDPAAKQSGGDMGWGNLSAMAPQLAETLKGLNKGQYTTKPFQSPMGWHVIKVEDVRTAKLPPLEQVKPQIVRQLEEETVSKAMADIRSKAKIQ